MENKEVNFAHDYLRGQLLSTGFCEKKVDEYLSIVLYIQTEDIKYLKKNINKNRVNFQQEFQQVPQRVLQRALYGAIVLNKVHVVKKLLKLNVDLRLKDNSGATVLHLAMAYSSSAMLEVLLENNTVNLLNQRNSVNQTALHYGVYLYINYYNVPDILNKLKLLLAKGLASDKDAKKLALGSGIKDLKILFSSVINTTKDLKEFNYALLSALDTRNFRMLLMYMKRKKISPSIKRVLYKAYVEILKPKKSEIILPEVGREFNYYKALHKRMLKNEEREKNNKEQARILLNSKNLFKYVEIEDIEVLGSVYSRIKNAVASYGAENLLGESSEELLKLFTERNYRLVQLYILSKLKKRGVDISELQKRYVKQSKKFVNQSITLCRDFDVIESAVSAKFMIRLNKISEDEMSSTVQFNNKLLDLESIIKKIKEIENKLKSIDLLIKAQIRAAKESDFAVFNMLGGAVSVGVGAFSFIKLHILAAIPIGAGFLWLAYGGSQLKVLLQNNNLKKQKCIVKLELKKHQQQQKALTEKLGSVKLANILQRESLAEELGQLSYKKLFKQDDSISAPLFGAMCSRESFNIAILKLQTKPQQSINKCIHYGVVDICGINLLKEYDLLNILPLKIKSFVRELNVSSTHINDNILIKMLNELLVSDLRYLNLSNNRIGLAGAKFIANLLKSNQLAKLKVLDLSANPITTDGLLLILDEMKTNTHLKFLDLSGCYEINGRSPLNMDIMSIFHRCLKPMYEQECILKFLYINDIIFSDRRKEDIKLTLAEIEIFLNGDNYNKICRLKVLSLNRVIYPKNMRNNSMFSSYGKISNKQVEPNKKMIIDHQVEDNKASEIITNAVADNNKENKMFINEGIKINKEDIRNKSSNYFQMFVQYYRSGKFTAARDDNVFPVKNYFSNK